MSIFLGSLVCEVVKSKEDCAWVEVMAKVSERLGFGSLRKNEKWSKIVNALKNKCSNLFKAVLETMLFI